MITDDQLYTLLVFLRFFAMLLIGLYHFVEVNSSDDESDQKVEGTVVQPRTGVLGEKITLKS